MSRTAKRPGGQNKKSEISEETQKAWLLGLSQRCLSSLDSAAVHPVHLTAGTRRRSPHTWPCRGPSARTAASPDFRALGLSSSFLPGAPVNLFLQFSKLAGDVGCMAVQLRRIASLDLSWMIQDNHLVGRGGGWDQKRSAGTCDPGPNLQRPGASAETGTDF